MPISYGITDEVFGYNPNSVGIGNSNGPRARTDYGSVHTQEGGSGNAIGLARYCNGAQVSYNIEVDDEHTVLNVPVHEAPWAAAEANDVAFHLCFAGSYAAWPRGRWLSPDASDGLDEDAMLWRGAQSMAAACQEFNIPVTYGGSDGREGWPLKRGIVGHRDFGWRGGGHTDPGDGFPMNEFVRRVASFFAPPVNLIDWAATEAHEWIGDRITEGENVCPDGKGRWAAFENAHIYWCPPANAAYAIPHGGLFEAWADHGWETGPLGYPILHHEVVAGGAVQAFQGGVLMRRNGAPTGYFVHGEIGKRYGNAGFEQSGMGWPTSDEYPHNTGIRQDFEHGSLFWDPSGVVQLLDSTEAS